MFLDRRKETERRREHDRLVKRALEMDSVVIEDLFRIFPYDWAVEVYRVYNEFLTIGTSDDAFDLALWYGLKYE